jgi:hypothetical protein
MEMRGRWSIVSAVETRWSHRKSVFPFDVRSVVDIRRGRSGREDVADGRSPPGGAGPQRGGREFTRRDRRFRRRE